VVVVELVVVVGWVVVDVVEVVPRISFCVVVAWVVVGAVVVEMVVVAWVVVASVVVASVVVASVVVASVAVVAPAPAISPNPFLSSLS
jgi:hypothetical protein